MAIPRPRSRTVIKSPEVEDPQEQEMSFLDHLDVLRKHILRSLIAVIVCGIIIYVLGNTIFDKIIFGPKSPGFISYKLFCNLSEWLSIDALCMQPVPFEIITVGLGEAFMTHLKVAFVGGIVMAFPYIFYQFWQFIKPGLRSKEIRTTRGVVFVCSFLFVLGVLFGYFIISPFAINFLAGYEVSSVVNTVTLTSFVNYMVMFTLPTGIAFELPLVIFYLAKLGVVTPEGMRQYRRHAAIVILIVASIITPPDAITQLLIGVPIYILYEMSIFIAAREVKKYEKSQAKQ